VRYSACFLIDPAVTPNAVAVSADGAVNVSAGGTRGLACSFRLPARHEQGCIGPAIIIQSATM